MKSAKLCFIVSSIFLAFSLVSSLWNASVISLPSAYANPEPNATILNLEEISLPSGVFAYSVTVFKDKVMIGTNDSRVFMYENGVWNHKLTTAYPNKLVSLDHDGNNLLVAPIGTPKVYHTTDGNAYKVSDTVIPAHPQYVSVLFKKAWLGNGTVLAAGYGATAPVYALRSDDYGYSWYIWKNFTEMFPLTAQNIGSLGTLWKHAHAIVYAPNYIAVSMGDDYRAIVVSRDGGVTWTIEKHGAHTGMLKLSDRIIFFPDGCEEMMIYYLDTQEYVNIPLQEYGWYESFWFDYDVSNDIVYAGFYDVPSKYHGIMASYDKGLSWITIYKAYRPQFSASVVFPYVDEDRYAYFAMVDNKVYRFKPLTKNEVLALAKSTVSRMFYNQVHHHSFGNSSVVDVDIAVVKENIINKLNNSDAEQGQMTYANGFPTYFAREWGTNGTDHIWTIDNSGGLNNSKAIKLQIWGTGGAWLGAQNYYTDAAERLSFPHDYGLLITAYYKLNRTTEGLLSTFIAYFNTTGYYYSVTLLPTTTWQRVVGFIKPPIATSGEWQSTVFITIDAEYKENNYLTNIPATTVWIDNAAIIPLPKDLFPFRYAVPDKKLSWRPNGTILNIEPISFQVNDVTYTTNVTLTQVLTPLRLNAQYGGLLNFNISRKRTYIETNVAIIDYELATNIWRFKLKGASGSTSTTKVYCGDKGAPTAVYITNGTLTWSYDASTTILTLNVVHDGPANMSVDWRIAGDVNGDGEVIYSDLFILSKAYGSEPSKSDWNPDCDFNGDNKIDASDLFSLSKNYGKRKTES